MDECSRRYGDSFTLKIANEGTWVFITDPDAMKQVFTGDPRLLHAGEANVVLLPVLGSNSVLLLDEAAHMRQRKLMLPPFHGDRLRGYAETMREVTEEAISLLAARQAARDAPADAGADARDHHAHRLRRAGRGTQGAPRGSPL